MSARPGQTEAELQPLSSGHRDDPATVESGNAGADGKAHARAGPSGSFHEGPEDPLSIQVPEAHPIVNYGDRTRIRLRRRQRDFDRRRSCRPKMDGIRYQLLEKNRDLRPVA